MSSIFLGGAAALCFEIATSIVSLKKHIYSYNAVEEICGEGYKVIGKSTHTP